MRSHVPLFEGLGYANAGACMSRPLQFSIFYGYPAELVAEWCSVSVRTARLYKNGSRKPSKQAVRLFLLHRDGRVLTRPWAGWRVSDRAIVDPEGNETTHAQLRGYWLVMQYAKELARERGPESVEHFMRLLA